MDSILFESEKSVWNKIEDFFKINFTQGDTIDLNGMLFIIGVQELGMGDLKFKKEDKLNLLHIAVCRLLEPFGFYEFEGLAENGWPQYKNIKKIPQLEPNEQTILMKKAIINYFEQEQLI